jgi:uncharacterized protein
VKHFCRHRKLFGAAAQARTLGISVVQFTLQARHGRGVRLSPGASIRVTNIHGSQVVDTWAISFGEPRQHSSMDHTRSVNSNIFANRGTVIVSDQRTPMLVLTEDTSPGRHDTLLCPCNAAIYRELGCVGHHRSCTENFHEALREFDIALSFTPASLNLFMNVPIAADGTVIRKPPRARPGDYVVLKAASDLVVVFSACPQDITPINGPDLTPRDISIEVFPASVR